MEEEIRRTKEENISLQNQIKTNKIKNELEINMWKEEICSKDDTIEKLKLQHSNEIQQLKDEKSKLELDLSKCKTAMIDQSSIIENLKLEISKLKQESQTNIQSIKSKYENQLNQLTTQSDINNIEMFYKQKLLTQKVKLVSII